MDRRATAVGGIVQAVGVPPFVFLTAHLFLALTFVVAVPLSTRAEELRYQGKTVAEWAQALKDDDPALRARAPQAIAQFGPRAAPVLPALQEGLGGPDRVKRMALILTLGKIGPPALPALLDCLDREESEDAVTAALRDVGYPAVSPLRRGLESEDVVLRRRSIHGLPCWAPLLKARCRWSSKPWPTGRRWCVSARQRPFGRSTAVSIPGCRSSWRHSRTRMPRYGDWPPPPS